MAKYFVPKEFACPCCGKAKVDTRLYDLLDDIREKVGVPLYINSGYRCKKHNIEVGGVPNSTHFLGQAADIDATDIGVEKLARIAEECGADGVGRYYGSNFVHVDVRSGRIGETFRWEE